MKFESIYNGRILLVNMATGAVEEEELDAAQVEEDLGGAAINLSLYKEYEKGDPIIIGTGPLTASFAPASCLGIATARSPITKGIVHVPLTWQNAVDLKLSGFDFIVITGECPSPKRLWLHDEIAEILDAQGYAGKDVGGIVKGLRVDHGDDMVQVIGAGPAGQKGSRAARLSESLWGSKDSFALASLMAGKNLLAVASRGLGYFEIDDAAFQEAMALRRPLVETGSAKGLIQQLEALGGNDEARDILEKYTHRVDACFHCPGPCNTFLMLDQDPNKMEEPDLEEPGFLLTSLADLLAVAGLGDASLSILRACLKMGINPVYAAEVLKKRGITGDRALEELESLSSGVESLSSMEIPNFYEVPAWPGAVSLEARLTQCIGIFSNLVPPVLSGEGFSSIADAEERAKEHLLRQAAGYILGICPVFMVSTPALTFELLAQTAGVLLGEEITPDRLRSASARLIRSTLEAYPPQGSIHESLLTDGLSDKKQVLLAGL